MTRPDPIQPQAVPEGAPQPAASAASVLSANPAVRAVQEGVVGLVDRITPALDNVRRHAGAGFRLRAVLALILGERKEETVQDNASLLADLATVRQYVGAQLEDADHVEYVPSEPAKKVA